MQCINPVSYTHLDVYKRQAPTVNKAFAARDEEPILKRAKQQLDAGAVYLDVNIGPAENDGEDIMKWAVELLQSNFDNVPLALDTSNKKAIEAGISVYNRSKGKPIVNSADAAGRIEYVCLLYTSGDCNLNGRAYSG